MPILYLSGQKELNFEKASFRGKTYEKKKDKNRLVKGLNLVFRALSQNKWMTVEEIQKETGLLNPMSVSAQIRNLRKPPFKLLIEQRWRNGVRGLSEYKIIGLK